MPSYVFLLLILASINKLIWGQNRIIGGQNADISEFPFMININVKGNTCSGSILSTNWALTAAHCFDLIGKNFTIEDYTITSGDAYVGKDDPISKTRETHKMKQYYIHEKYHDHAKFGYDIAVFEVIEPFVFGPNTSAIRLPSSSEEATAPTGKAAGWGCTVNYGSPNAYLKYVWLQKKDDDECENWYPYIEQKQSVLCYVSGYNTRNLGNGGNVCSGDSGGPLFTAKNIVVGVLSLRIISNLYKPACYTNVFYYRDWIKKKTKL